MNERIKQKLLDKARQNTGTKGKFRVAAGLVYKNKLIAVGVNSYKTHPWMINGEYKPEQIHLHAEADCLIRASKILTEDQIKDSSIYVVRVLKDGSEALAKPCRGCSGLIARWGITDVKYTVSEGESK